jgi:hypothetical protein
MLEECSFGAWPCPLVRDRLGYKRLPWLPGEHLAGEDEFIFCLQNQLLHLTTFNLALELCDISSLQNASGKITYIRKCMQSIKILAHSWEFVL